MNDKLRTQIYDVLTKNSDLPAWRIREQVERILGLLVGPSAPQPVGQMPRVDIGSGVHFQVSGTRCIPAIVDRVHSDGKVDLVAYSSEMGAWSWASGVPYGYYAHSWHRNAH